MDNLIYLDRTIFYAINSLPHPWFADVVAMALSGISRSGLLWLIVGVVLIVREEIRDKLFFFRLVSTIIVALFVSEWVLKPFIGRLRPVFEYGTIIVTGIMGQYSFPSTHATIAFAAARILSDKEQKIAAGVYVLAFCVGLSRIYLGHHYPIDVLGGSVLGLCIGESILLLFKHIHRVSPKHSRKKQR